MKNVISSILISGSMLTVLGIAQADMLTGRSIADAYVSGQLEDRLQELGTNKQTKEFTPLWRATQEDGIRLHCNRVFAARGDKDAGVKCAISASKYAHTR